MGLVRKVPSEIAELVEQEQGEPEGPDRFSSARFTVRLPAKPQPPAAATDGEEAAEPED